MYSSEGRPARGSTLPEVYDACPKERQMRGLVTRWSTLDHPKTIYVKQGDVLTALVAIREAEL
jgi:hypothetical protein